MLCVFLLCGAVLLGYQVARKTDGLSRFNPVAGLWAQQVAGDREAIETLRQHLKDNVQVLTQRVGLLQAEVTRLNAVGMRVAKMAGLSSEEFDFDHPPPMGGPQTAADDSLPSVEQLSAELDAVAARLDSHARAFPVLLDLMVAGELRKQLIPSGRPTLTSWITSAFGWRTDPFTGVRAFHEGVDFAAPMGSKIKAAAAGVVSFVGRKSGYGKLVEITHGNGFVTRYGHCSKILVDLGERVAKDESIAEVGSTGRSTGPHVHFEVLRNGKVVDPTRYIQAARK